MISARFINPHTDFGFKYLFGREETKGFLISLLNEILKGERQIKELEFMDKERVPRSYDDRTILYDVLCRSDSGEEFIVEMQRKDEGNFKDRCIYYESSLIATQGEQGRDWNFRLIPVYIIVLMEFNVSRDEKLLRRDVGLMDMKTNELFSDKFRMIFIDLNAMDKLEEECDTNFERWIYILKNMDRLKEIPYKEVSDMWADFEVVADVGSMSRAERRDYESSLNSYRVLLSAFEKTAEEGWEKGLTEGRAQGLTEGRAQGLTEGRAQGLVEGRAEGRAEGMTEGKRVELVRMVLNMKALGLDEDAISKVSGLSVAEINEIKP